MAMCIIHLRIRCSDKYSEWIVDDEELTELAIESIVGPALLEVFDAVQFENVTVQPSPLWLQFRLEAIGLNPISNIVDVTNFIMAELAQPMHAFDADKLHGGQIIVRPAHPGEKLARLS